MRGIMPCKLPLSLFAVALLAGCSSSERSGDAQKTSDQASAKPATAPPSSSAQPGAAGAVPASASPTVAAATPESGPPVCTRTNEKVWGSGANKLTGLTTKRVDTRTAIGYAIGVEPRVLVLDKAGKVESFKVKTGGSAKPPAAGEGFRSLMRVSPTAIEGDMARAVIDYHDDYKDKRRRVACGPADSDENFLVFEGTSYLDMDPKPEGEDKKKLFSWKKEGGYVELRDCRTFVTRQSNEMWALGSVLRATEKPDGTNEWKVVFLVDFGKGDKEIVLHETALKGDPPKPPTYEIPTSRRVKDKGYVIATRFGGSLLVGVLNESRKLQGKFKAYKGFPTMPDFGRADEEIVITTGIGAGKEKKLKALFIPRDTLELPSDYVDVSLVPMEGAAAGETSFTSPELTVDTKGQRWFAYVEGPPNKAHLRLVPVDKALKPLGRAFSVTTDDTFASEARLTALDDGRMTITYLRDTKGKVDIVTEQLSCEVKP
jgi:hypothetical protein